ncbi:hypothetical protein I5R65_17730 [Herbaspirillum sp. AP02]|uniref:hypothetical protein n=1 Tax=unclassified Herbaspirillum TaxID=2624150 RepID=UPI0015DABA37|nr:MULTISPECIES: hypothetical protein [unclassified Herbaspirillum]MBG7621309.1 hypothetical protein [Herbaspirillum sp. AP02]NZD66858.1 hypothetical protein [Herbaspirillum sp. AP21]
MIISIAPVFSAIKAAQDKGAGSATCNLFDAVLLRHLSHLLSPTCRLGVAGVDTHKALLPGNCLCCSAMIYVNVKSVLSSSGRPLAWLSPAWQD